MVNMEHEKRITKRLLSILAMVFVSGIMLGLGPVSAETWTHQGKTYLGETLVEETWTGWELDKTFNLGEMCFNKWKLYEYTGSCHKLLRKDVEVTLCSVTGQIEVGGEPKVILVNYIDLGATKESLDRIAITRCDDPKPPVPVDWLPVI